jgi:beta-glucanase (GH16 family)
MRWIKIKRTALFLIMSSLLSSLFMNCSGGKPFEAVTTGSNSSSSSGVLTVPTPQASATPVPGVTVTPTPVAVSNGVLIAQDFSQFSVTPNSVVRYGTITSYVQMTLGGDAWCTANFFGKDPAPSETKACYLMSGSLTSPTPTPTPKPTPVATPVSTPKPTPIPTPVATPVSTPKPTPIPTPVATPTPAPTTVSPPAQAAGYKLVFKDDFDSLSLNRSQQAPFDNSTWFQGFPWDLGSNPGTFDITASVLTINSKAGGGTQLNSISRDNKFGRAWTYGYFEARLKWNIIDGNFPAFWLFSSEHAVGGDYENGIQHWCEIDIFEGQGLDPHTFYGTIHDWVNFNNNQNGNNQYPVPGDMNEFHTYGVLWTSSLVTWYYDDKPVMSAPVPEICTRQKLEMIIGSQRGGWSNSPNTTGDMKTVVDWVHVFQK